MLREYSINSSRPLLSDALSRFTFAPSVSTEDFTLLSFITLTPDSFIWKLIIDDAVYFLYAEDYVPGLRQVEYEIKNCAGNEDMKLTFIPANASQAFEDTSPNKSAQIYKPPQDEYNFMKYAVSSGYDFVFLCKTDIPVVDAYFTE